MTLARLLELRAAMMENRQPEPPLNGSEYVTLVNCTERYMRLAQEAAAWIEAEENEAPMSQLETAAYLRYLAEIEKSHKLGEPCDE